MDRGLARRQRRPERKQRVHWLGQTLALSRREHRIDEHQLRRDELARLRHGSVKYSAHMKLIGSRGYALKLASQLPGTVGNSVNRPHCWLQCVDATAHREHLQRPET
jgi:hypothetical protein